MQIAIEPITLAQRFSDLGTPSIENSRMSTQVQNKDGILILAAVTIVLLAGVLLYQYKKYRIDNGSEINEYETEK